MILLVCLSQPDSNSSRLHTGGYLLVMTPVLRTVCPGRGRCTGRASHCPNVCGGPGRRKGDGGRTGFEEEGGHAAWQRRRVPGSHGESIQHQTEWVPPRDASEGKGPPRFGRRLEEVAKAVGGGYCRLQMPSRLALGVRGTVAGHRLGALQRGGGGGLPPPFPMHPCPPSAVMACTLPVLSALRAPPQCAACPAGTTTG